VSRELGKPGVVETKHAKHILRAGESIKVDGACGQVKRQNRKG